MKKKWWKVRKIQSTKTNNKSDANEKMNKW